MLMVSSYISFSLLIDYQGIFFPMFGLLLFDVNLYGSFLFEFITTADSVSGKRKPTFL